jgi:membrane protein required for colicin V production
MFTWLDYIIIAIFSLALFIGIWRGLVREFIALGIWITAFAISILFSPWLADKMATVFADPRLRISLAFAGLFLATLLVGIFVNFLVSESVPSSNLSMMNRFIGGLLGLIRAVLIVAVLLLVCQMINLNNSATWRNSLFVPYFASSSNGVSRILRLQENRYVADITVKEGKS